MPSRGAGHRCLRWQPCYAPSLPPAELVRPCPGEPPLPDVFVNDAEQADWINGAIEAGAECRAAHRELSQWVLSAP